MRLSAYLLLTCLNFIKNNDALVTVKMGKTAIEGETVEVNKTKVDSFYVNYGKRARRFGPTEYTPINRDAEVIIGAKQTKYKCPVIRTFAVQQEQESLGEIISGLTHDPAVEDSLRCQGLYIHRLHRNDDSKQKPAKVLVYLHGGGNNWGSANQGLNQGKNFFRHGALNQTVSDDGVILVMVSYGLGPFGYWTSLEKEEKSLDVTVKANAAVMDAILGLRWVQEHIAHFGGNPREITLVGHSAGAALGQAVHLALKDWKTFGFKHQPFHRLLLLSGSVLLFEPIKPEEAIEQQKKLLAPAGCADNDKTLEEQFKCLEDKSDEEIVKAANEGAVTWTTTIDNYLIHDTPENSIRNELFMKDVEVLLTSTEQDASLFTCMHKPHIDKYGFQILHAFEQGHLTDEFEKSYLLEGGNDENDKDQEESTNYKAVTCAITHSVFTLPAVKLEKLYVDAGLKASAHVFQFTFSAGTSTVNQLVANASSMFNTAFSWIKSEKTIDNGLQKALYYLRILKAFHGAETALLFDAPLGNGYSTLQASSEKQAKEVLEPIFQFIHGKSFKPCKLYEEKEFCDVVTKFCIRTAVRKLYDGSIDFTRIEIKVSENKNQVTESSMIKEKQIEKKSLPTNEEKYHCKVKQSLVEEYFKMNFKSNN